MGTPIPNPIVPPPAAAGLPCPVCWGLGKPFGDVETPYYIIANISGVNKGPLWTPADGEPVDGEFLLGQDLPLACRWRGIVGLIQVVVSWETDPGFAEARRIGGQVLFRNLLVDQCDVLIPNQYAFIFNSGSMLITIPVVP